ncbi:NADH dehydrogenase [ubiquinone] 1 alpha subcomplex assembly factor 3 [Entomortierella parvispora]|uniref:NADH dehydrogenase [ubiquinone] 1 alpha subcomplex assembly factor 3 n=1 Tax=Entomortierella parvispora TaxID=205924 RepID=A0A9P3H5I5_9FUNG|nr:NADH dehydrogenase [ubiquinone] 1 alpha subcomplex assembly factor 3 [Entomortierella parvispora]
MSTAAILRRSVLQTFRPRIALKHSRPFTAAASLLRPAGSGNATPGQDSTASTSTLRQKSVPMPGAHEDADSAISGFMNMFNDRESKTVSITTCTKHGFVTTEAITLQGPVLCIGGQVFLWDIFQKGGAVDRSLSATTTATTGTGTTARSIFETMDEPTAREIFKIFELMNPRPEILVVGTGKAFAPLSPAVRSVIRSLGLQVDMMSTANAAATYNMLAEEGREVAAALLPLEPSTVQTVRSDRP